MGKTDRCRYNFRVYDGYKVLHDHKLGILSRGHQVFLWDVLTLLLPCIPSGYATSPWAYSCRSNDTLFLFGRTI